jgi:hypothetical protein
MPDTCSIAGFNMNIRGTVTDARRQTPIPGAKIVLAIGDREFATTSTNNLGRFEHREDQNLPGQTLICTVEKEKFETVVIQRPIDSEILNLTIIMSGEQPGESRILNGEDNKQRIVRHDGLVEALEKYWAKIFVVLKRHWGKIFVVLKEHWAKIFAGIALLILIGVALSTCSRPSIKTFSASSLNVKRGEKVTLRWETAKANLVTLNGAKVALSGTTERTPPPYSYELIAKNDYGKSQKHIAVTVIPVPRPTVRFWVEPLQVEKDETAVLHWETTGATDVKINGDKVGLSGPQEVKANATQTYKLVAQNEDGEKEESSVTLKVLPSPPPGEPRMSFKATHKTVRPGEETTLSWETDKVKIVELKQGDQPPQKVAQKGEIKITPSASTTYNLTGYPEIGPPITKIVNIRVAAPIPPPNGKLRAIFTAQPNSIQQGQPTQLTWKVENAKEVKFKAEDDSEKSLPLIGSMQVTPNATTTYTLSARSESGQTVKKTVSVRVTSGSDVLTTNGAEDAEVVRVKGFTYVLRIRGKEYTVTADTHTNKDSNISSGTSVTVRVDKNRLLEIKR